MKTLKEADVQPLDLLLFSGTDGVSAAIRCGAFEGYASRPGETCRAQAFPALERG